MGGGEREGADKHGDKVREQLTSKDMMNLFDAICSNLVPDVKLWKL